MGSQASCLTSFCDFNIESRHRSNIKSKFRIITLGTFAKLVT